MGERKFYYQQDRDALYVAESGDMAPMWGKRPLTSQDTTKGCAEHVSKSMNRFLTFPVKMPYPGLEGLSLLEAIDKGIVKEYTLEQLETMWEQQ